MKAQESLMDDLKRGVQHSVSNIVRNVKAYVFEGDDAAYRIVAVELRKLLLDTNAAASFLEKGQSKRNKRSLYELYHSSGKNIYLRSFLPIREADSETQLSDYKPVTPAIYGSRVDILYHATHGGRLVDLKDWLEEPFVYNSNGAVLKVRTVLLDMADKEGSHIISLKGKDKREDVRIAYGTGPIKSEDLPSLSFIGHWEQFIVDAGMRLLDARWRADLSPLIDHGIVVPQTGGSPTRIEKRGMAKTVQRDTP